VLIMTSNLGAEHLLAGVSPTGDLAPGTEEQVLAAVRSHFRPEFLNRLDDIVVFTPLSRPDLRQIIRLQLDNWQQRLNDKGLTLAPTDDGLDAILDAAWDPVYGARPLRRYLDHQLGTALSRLLISQAVAPGTTLIIDADASGLAITAQG
jgi:ATP-dependent Clp protease ATP-binding subunit ClpB